MDLQLQINSDDIQDPAIFEDGNNLLMVTPPVGDMDYWLFKVMVSDKQSIIGFPKFMQIGIGFQLEEDWNSNLPSTSSAEEIFNHISHNKGDDAIPDERCIEAIKLIQEAAATYQEKNNADT
jgi:hypothetical protein